MYRLEADGLGSSEHSEVIDPLEVLVGYQKALMKFLDWDNHGRYYCEDDLNYYEGQIEGFKDQLEPREFARYAFSIAIVCGFAQYPDLSRKWLAWAEEKAPPDVAEEINMIKGKHVFIGCAQQS